MNKSIQVPVVTEKPQPEAVTVAYRRAEAKIREDLFRFRTCCADPRASK